MRRNYRPNNRLYYRRDNENQMVNNTEHVTNADINSPSDTEDESGTRQDKENTLINTEKADLDDSSENIINQNAEDNSVKEITGMDISAIKQEEASETTPEAISEIVPETASEATTETIPETAVEDLKLIRDEIKEQKEGSQEIQNKEEGLVDSDRDIIIINKERYEILASEHAYVFHPEYFDISPTWTSDSNFRYKCLFELKDNQLYLKSFQVTSDRGYPIINNVKPEICNLVHGLETVQYVNVNEPLKYSGAIMFANSLVKDYRLPYHMDWYNPPCFSYKFVGELIFDEGKLITSVNHNKAMLRIRKNIDLGLRSLDKKQDIKCIKKFIKVSFIGDYQYQKKKQKRIWKDNFKNISAKNKEVHIMESGKRSFMDKIKHMRTPGSK